MNYYYAEYENSENPLVKDIISLADQILTLYIEGDDHDKLKSLEITDKLLKDVKLYVENVKDTSLAISDIKEVFSGGFPQNKSIIFIETLLVIKRVEYYFRGEKIYDFGLEHNAMFVSFLMILLGFTKKSVFGAQIKEYIASTERAFPYNKESGYTGRKRLFYRNAYRAEMYSHRFYTDLNPEGMYDMYTPLILTRMATEQYLKELYEKSTGKDAPNTPAECRIELREGKVITRYYARELWAVLERGNINTHQGESNYAFANLHGIKVLTHCFKEMNK